MTLLTKNMAIQGWLAALHITPFFAPLTTGVQQLYNIYSQKINKHLSLGLHFLVRSDCLALRRLATATPPALLGSCGGG